MSLNIFNLIELAQNNDKHSLICLVEKFDPLLKKYAYKLNDIDAYNNLRADFIEFILNVDTKKIRSQNDAKLVSYISTSIYHFYLKQSILLNCTKKTLLLSDLSEAQITKIEEQSAVNEMHIYHNLEYALSKLTSKEKKLIHLIFYNEITIPEVAKLYGTSRQAINQKKIRILKKMKCILSKYEEGIQ